MFDIIRREKGFSVVDFSKFTFGFREGIVKPGTDLSTLQGQIEFKPPGISAAGNHIVGQGSVFSGQP